ncbi:hypothetical protein VB005_04771 [Metarhizium brunneum]
MKKNASNVTLSPIGLGAHGLLAASQLVAASSRSLVSSCGLATFRKEPSACYRTPIKTSPAITSIITTATATITTTTPIIIIIIITTITNITIITIIIIIVIVTITAVTTTTNSNTVSDLPFSRLVWLVGPPLSWIIITFISSEPAGGFSPQMQ